MAQTLKNEVRNSILNATMDLLLNNDPKDVSMRQIAINANMTVGNLYRYYASKEDLLNELYKPVLDHINSIIGKYANGNLVLFQDVVGIEFDINILPFIVQGITSELVDMFGAYELSVKVLITDQQLMSNVTAWLMDVLATINNSQNTKAYYELMAYTIINGLIHIHSKDYDNETMTQVINQFLIKMIDV